MRMSEGVEWAAHACAVLATLPPGRGLPAVTLAGFHELPPDYMAKHLQALARAGLVASLRGARGGYRLARPPAEISLWDITAAIEGGERAFRCQDIVRRGPCAGLGGDSSGPCPIAAAFWAAEDAYRDALRGRTVADLTLQVGAGKDEQWRRRYAAWLSESLEGRRR